MALAARFLKHEEAQVPVAVAVPPTARPARDVFELRAMPMEALVFYRKPINNSRLVREADPQARGACWTSIGGAAIACAFLFGILAPNLLNTVAAKKIGELRVQQEELLRVKRALEFEEAELISPEKLERYAAEQQLVTPGPGQVTRLDGAAASAVAMAKQ